MISNKIVGWMIYQKVISLEERKLYLYALQSFYFSIAPFILAILIGSVMKQFLNGVFLGITISIVRSIVVVIMRRRYGYAISFRWLF